MHLQLWQIEALIELVEEHKNTQSKTQDAAIWDDILDRLNSELFKLST
tara:strand:- start:3469 stop:3612 length:144 start_codon:yes stop_codon:yes gene_type:complete